MQFQRENIIMEKISFVSFASALVVFPGTGGSAYCQVKKACTIAGHPSYSSDAELVLGLLELDGGEEATIAKFVAQAYLDGTEGFEAVKEALAEIELDNKIARRQELRYLGKTLV
jgi:hypothetical protein